jgi:hypothetical protein
MEYDYFPCESALFDAFAYIHCPKPTALDAVASQHPKVQVHQLKLLQKQQQLQLFTP